MQNVNNVICSLVALVSRVMCDSCSTQLVDSVDRHTQLFLNFYGILDKFLTKDGNKGWVSHYNFLCSLNIPDMMSQYGPLRNLWEGGFRGEGFIRIVKPLVANGLRKSWAKSLMTRILKLMAFYRLKNPLGNSGDVDDLEELFDDIELEARDPIREDKNWHPYKSVTEISTKFQDGKPLSCVMYEGSTVLYCRTAEKEKPIKRATYRCQKVGMHYHSYALGEEREVSPKESIKKFCLLLPMLTDKGLPKRIHASSSHTAINSDWEVMQQDGTMSWLRVPGCTYSETLI